MLPQDAVCSVELREQMKDLNQTAFIRKADNCKICVSARISDNGKDRIFAVDKTLLQRQCI